MAMVFPFRSAMSLMCDCFSQISAAVGCEITLPMMTAGNGLPDGTLAIANTSCGS
jgi:hypothetical protein